MIHIAIIEDEGSSAQRLQNCLVKWGDKRNTKIDCVVFNNALDFLDEYKANYDIVFMDIEMPHYTGLEAAHALRKVDPYVLLCFVTNMQQYAIEGYTVEALDFIVKPVSYYAIATLMEKVLRILNSRMSKAIAVKTRKGYQKISIDSIYYIEIYNHKISFHTDAGIVESWGTLKDLENNALFSDFARCNVGILVNLKHVSAVESEEVLVGSERLKVSRLRKKEFLFSIANYLGGGV